jgi:hypothetical protein
MPAATLRVEGERVCASLASSIIQPCFYLERTNAESFRGTISGLSFAYCDFTRYKGRAHFVHVHTSRGCRRKLPTNNRSAP